MNLIQRVEVEGFRSLRKVEIRTGSFSAITGRNNSGKSNLLRALNLFFNDEIEPNIQLDFARDYYRHRKGGGAQKITIGITFALPKTFNFRKNYQDVAKLLKGASFTIKKRWQRSRPDIPVFFLGDQELDAEKSLIIRKFLGLIKFRYFQAGASPLDTIRREGSSLQSLLLKRARISEQSEDQTPLFMALAEAAKTLLLDPVRHFKSDLLSDQNAALLTPASIEDLFFPFAFQIASNGVTFDDSVQGSGIQSLLTLATSYMVDCDYSQRFGYRQATIWALEEPEVYLHSDLEATVASGLLSMTSEESARLQIICSTHSGLFLQHSNFSSILSINSSGESICETTGVTDVASIKKASELGISQWQDPLLYYPKFPLLIVEGKSDFEILHQAFRLANIDLNEHNIKVSYLELLDAENSSTGGIEATKRFLKNRLHILRLRPENAKIVVLLDWESQNRAAIFNELRSKQLKCVVWPEDHLNPELDQTFRGIERALSTQIITSSDPTGTLIGRKGNGALTINQQNLEPLKHRILSRIQNHRLSIDDISHFVDFLPTLISTILTP